jgi:integrase/recombinase XerD
MVVIDRFLEMLAAEKGATRSTLSAYETDLKNFFKFLKGKDIYSVVSTDIKDYLITQKHLAATSLARRISSLRQFYKFLMSEGEIVENPTSLIEAPRYRRKLPSILSETDINHLLEGAKSWNGPEGLRLFALLEILYASGLRVSELVSLSFISAVEALKNKKPFLLIRGKGNKDRLVPLTPTAVDALHKP